MTPSSIGPCSPQRWRPPRARYYWWTPPPGRARAAALRARSGQEGRGEAVLRILVSEAPRGQRGRGVARHNGKARLLLRDAPPSQQTETAQKHCQRALGEVGRGRRDRRARRGRALCCVVPGKRETRWAQPLSRGLSSLPRERASESRGPGRTGGKTCRQNKLQKANPVQMDTPGPAGRGGFLARAPSGLPGAEITGSSSRENRCLGPPSRGEGGSAASHTDGRNFFAGDAFCLTSPCYPLPGTYGPGPAPGFPEPPKMGGQTDRRGGKGADTPAQCPVLSREPQSHSNPPSATNVHMYGGCVAMGPFLRPPGRLVPGGKDAAVELLRDAELHRMSCPYVEWSPPPTPSPPFPLSLSLEAGVIAREHTIG